MKHLQHHTIPEGDDLCISKEIRGAGDKTICFCIKDKEEELYYAPMSKEGEVYTIEMEDEVFKALDKGDYDYSIRIQDKPIRTIGKGKLTIE